MRVQENARNGRQASIPFNKKTTLFLLLAAIGVFPAFSHEACEERSSSAVLNILAGSQATIQEGDDGKPIPVQTIPIGRFPPDGPEPTFTLLNRIVLPELGFAFSQNLDFSHEGPTVGKFLEAGDDIDLVFVLKVTEDTEESVSVEFPFSLSTRDRWETNFCFTPQYVAGTPRDAAGNFHLIGLGAIPFGSGSIADCKKITIEIFGQIVIADGDGDSFEDFVDNCPEYPNNGQADMDADGVGDDCDNCPTFNTSQRDFDGDLIGDACDPWMINFQPAGAPIPDDYTADDGDIFMCTTGSGWEIDMGPAARDRNLCSDQENDTLIFSTHAKWEIELPNRDYQVAVGVGDCGYVQGPHRVNVEGVTIIDGVMTGGANPDNHEETDRVKLRDGFLTVEIGNGINFTTINYVKITPVGEISQPDLMCSFNFQPATETDLQQYLEDNGLDFNEAVGYGWDPTGPFMETRDRALNCRQIIDSFTFTSPPGSWEFETPNGFFEVTIGIGDEMFGQGPNHVSAEGRTVFDGEVTAAGEHIVETRPVLVQDGKLSVSIGNGAGNTILDFLTISTAPPDVDGDGTLNEVDNCPFVANNQLDDADSDGVGDLCDLCTDTDGDGYGDPGFPVNTCALDCDEADPYVGAPPIEVTGVGASGGLPVYVFWDNQREIVGQATDYEMATGDLSNLGYPSPFFGSCLMSPPGPFYEDYRVPNPGDGYFYLIRATNSCGDGSWGTGTTATDYRALLSGAGSCMP